MSMFESFGARGCVPRNTCNKHHIVSVETAIFALQKTREANLLQDSQRSTLSRVGVENDIKVSSLLCR